MGDEKPTESPIEKHGKNIWEFFWDWRKESKRHLEIGYHFFKKYPFTVFALVLITCILTWFPVREYDSSKLDSVKIAYQSTNSFLEGKVSLLTGQLQTQKEDYNQKINEDATALANLRADDNEKLRSKDVEIQKTTAERDNALLRIANLEAMPTALLAAYTNLNANTPTNLVELTRILEVLTNSPSKAYNAPTFTLTLNKKVVLTERPHLNVFFSTNRAIFFTIQNNSDFSTEKLTMDFQTTTLDPTNFIYAHDWSAYTKYLENAHVWTWEAEHVLEGQGFFDLTTINISTNYNQIGLPFIIELYSSGSKVQRYDVIINFTQMSDELFVNMTNQNPLINIQRY